MSLPELPPSVTLFLKNSPQGSFGVRPPSLVSTESVWGALVRLPWPLGPGAFWLSMCSHGQSTGETETLGLCLLSRWRQDTRSGVRVSAGVWWWVPGGVLSTILARNVQNCFSQTKAFKDVSWWPGDQFVVFLLEYLCPRAPGLGMV